MTPTEKEPREGIEGWIDERIRQGLCRLPFPLDRRIRRLRRRIATLRERMEGIAARVDRDLAGDSGKDEKGGGES